MKVKVGMSGTILGNANSLICVGHYFGSHFFNADTLTTNPTRTPATETPATGTPVTGAVNGRFSCNPVFMCLSVHLCACVIAVYASYVQSFSLCYFRFLIQENKTVLEVSI